MIDQFCFICHSLVTWLWWYHLTFISFPSSDVQMKIFQEIILTLYDICNSCWSLISVCVTERFAITFRWFIHVKGISKKKDSDIGVNWLWLFWILQCKCWPGFQLKDDGKTCIDVDECSTGFPCSQRCINTYGTYKCLCTDGYEIQPGNPHGCKSLSGIKLNLSTDPTLITHMHPELHSHFIKFIHSCCFSEINILSYLPWSGIWHFDFMLSTNCSVYNNIALWFCELLRCFFICLFIFWDCSQVTRTISSIASCWITDS